MSLYLLKTLKGRFLISKEFKGRGSDEPRRNMEIRASQVRVIDDDGQMLGVLSLREAVQVAKDRNLDLIEISPGAKPPVCKLIDYGKFKYQKKKKQQESKKNQINVQIKEIQFSPRTEDHDIEYRIKHILRFLADGDKAKIIIMFRGREMAFLDLGYKLMEKITTELAGKVQIESPPTMEGKRMTMVLMPVKGVNYDAQKQNENQSGS